MEHQQAQKVKRAVEPVKERAPRLDVEGENDVVNMAAIAAVDAHNL